MSATMFKVGDKVFVKHTKSELIEDILKGTDRIVNIVQVDPVFPGKYRFEKNREYYSISQDDIAGYGFSYGQKIEVSCYGKHWDKRLFICYIDNNDHPWVVRSYISGRNYFYKYARPIQEPKEQEKEEPPLTQDELKQVRIILKNLVSPESTWICTNSKIEAKVTFDK